MLGSIEFPSAFQLQILRVSSPDWSISSSSSSFPTSLFPLYIYIFLHFSSIPFHLILLLLHSHIPNLLCSPSKKMRPLEPYSENNSDAESVASVRRGDRRAFSGPISSTTKPRKNAKFDLSSSSSSPKAANDDETYVEITLDIRDDSVAVHSVHTAGAGQDPSSLEDPELSLLAKRTLEKKSPSFRASVLRSTSSRIKQVSQELKRFTSLNRRTSTRRLDRTKSAATHALNGLKFIAAKTGGGGTSPGWGPVAKKFDELTANTNWLLPSSLFGECIGMNKDSKDFAGELFRALARRRNITDDFINKAQLKEFWDEICDDSFDSRLQIFFDM